MFGIEMSQVITIKDGNNNISMITLAGLGRAMGNATDEMKQYADIITTTNEDDGVAQIIREYVLTSN